MRKNKVTSIVLSLAMMLSTASAIPASATETKATKTISYNYVYDLASGYSADTVHTREMESLDRGLVAVKTSEGVYLSWRLFDSEDAKYGSADENVSFDIYRDGKKIATGSGTTNYLDKDGTADSEYYVLKEGESTEPITAQIKHDGSTVTVTALKAGVRAYAAKYGEGGSLESVTVREIETSGTSSFDIIIS